MVALLPVTAHVVDDGHLDYNSGASFGELYCIRQQVDEDLLEADTVTFDFNFLF